MNTYWVTFTDGTQACCQGITEYDAVKIAEHVSGKKVGGGPYKDFTVATLPYPADPVLWQHDHPIHGKTPTFCYAPRECAGKTSCQRNPCCVE